jgi:hypothetical protein
MVNFSLGKCKTKAAYSAKLKQKGILNLKKVSEKYEVLMNSPILVLIKVDNFEIIVHKHGEIFFKNCDNYPFMENLAKEIYNTCLE